MGRLSSGERTARIRAHKPQQVRTGAAICSARTRIEHKESALKHSNDILNKRISKGQLVFISVLSFFRNNCKRNNCTIVVRANVAFIL